MLSIYVVLKSPLYATESTVPSTRNFPLFWYIFSRKIDSSRSLSEYEKSQSIPQKTHAQKIIIPYAHLISKIKISTSTMSMLMYTHTSDPIEPGAIQRKNAIDNKKKKIRAVFSFFTPIF